MLDFIEMIAQSIYQSAFSKRKQLSCPDVKCILIRKPLKMGNVSHLEGIFIVRRQIKLRLLEITSSTG